ncbi:hypothetical protein SLE2022_007380 [Rubroshorea leprosula]
MQIVLPPSSTCSAIDSLNRKFLWGSDLQANKPHLVHWNDVYLSRRYGGLGVRSAKECNKALIAKLGWQILSRSEKPWCQAIKHKYLYSESFSSCKLAPSSSIMWRSILKTRDVLQLGTRWRVGFGFNIQLRNDIWVGNSKLLESIIAPVPQHLLGTKVSDIISNLEWNLLQLTDFVPENVLQLIATIPLSITGHLNDQIYWNAASCGDFTVKSAFSLIQQTRISSAPRPKDWTWIWHLGCTERVKLFVWLL